MKKTLNVAIGGCSFTIDEDAYMALESYLDSFKAGLDSSSSSSQVMDELEMRIADLLKVQIGRREVIDLNMVNAVLNQIGPVAPRPQQTNNNAGQQTQEDTYGGQQYKEAVRKFYRDAEKKRIAGVCSGTMQVPNILLQSSCFQHLCRTSLLPPYTAVRRKYLPESAVRHCCLSAEALAQQDRSD